MDEEAGFSLIEMTIVVAMIAILAAVATPSLSQQPYAIDAAIMQFSAMVDQAASLARTQGGWLNATTGTTADANTGSTIWVEPDPTDSSYSIATLYRLRPILENQCGGCIIRDPSTPPLRLRIQITAQVSGNVSRKFSIFLTTSSRLTAVTDAIWVPTSNVPISVEPICSESNPPTVSFSVGGNSKTLPLMCNEEVLVAPSSSPT